MFKRQKTGSVVCASCGSLVGVNDEQCYSCGRRNPGLWGFSPVLRRLGNDFGFVNLVVYGCSILYAAMLLVSVLVGYPVLGGGVTNLLSPAPFVGIAFGASGADPVFRLGMWWTVLSAGWLHGNALHILFNMLWVRQLGPATADIYGGARMVIIYTLASVAGFALSSAAGLLYLGGLPLPFMHGAGSTLGASAAIFGLLGALVHYGRRGGSSLVGGQALQYAIILGVFGLIMPSVDNYAHAGGFAGGYLASLWLDPLKRERMDHIIIAIACLALTALAVLASLVMIMPAILR